ncbi:glutamate ABC transporter substrate-binding protein [Actinophytocola sp.]|uniref:glutamate ABC transporter substrate-binding protein n=1 Tax=Actinophytocola sp. TaxID=1872138 RepID=UPI002ED6A0E5
MKKIALVLVLVLAAAGCTSTAAPVVRQTAAVDQPMPEGAKEVRALDPPSVDTSCGNPRASFRPNGPLPAPDALSAFPTVAAIRDHGKLVVGVDQNTYRFGYRNPETGEIEGFALDVAKEIAKAIFGRADADVLQLRVLTSKQREDALKAGDVDLVVHTMTTNCERWGWTDFSAVYYEATQKVLVKDNFDYQGEQSLAGKKVCATEKSTSLARIVNLDVDPKPVGMQVAGWTDCLVMLQQNQVDAVSTDDTILAGLADQDPFTKVVNGVDAPEPYAIAVPKKRDDLVRFVNAVLEKIKTDGTWLRIYDTWMKPLLGPVGAPPVAEYRD